MDHKRPVAYRQLGFGEGGERVILPHLEERHLERMRRVWSLEKDMFLTLLTVMLSLFSVRKLLAARTY